jgi:hypothetical protein
VRDRAADLAVDEADRLADLEALDGAKLLAVGVDEGGDALKHAGAVGAGEAAPGARIGSPASRRPRSAKVLGRRLWIEADRPAVSGVFARDHFALAGSDEGAADQRREWPGRRGKGERLQRVAS